MVSAMLSELTLNLLAARLQDLLAPSLFLMLLLHFGWAYLKGKSSAEVRRKVFSKLAAAPIEFSSSTLLDLEAREKELKCFKQAFRISAPGFSRTLDLAEWMMEYDIPAKDVRSAGDNFDLNKPGLKDRNFSLQRKIAGMLGVLFIAISLGFFSIVAFTHVVASFDDSPRFYINSEEVKFSLFSEDKLNLLSCKDPDKLRSVSESSGFPLVRAQAICDSFGNAEVDSWVKSKISSQRVSALFLSLIFAVPIYQLLLWLISVDAAMKIEKRLKRSLK